MSHGIVGNSQTVPGDPDCSESIPVVVSGFVYDAGTFLDDWDWEEIRTPLLILEISRWVAIDQHSLAGVRLDDTGALSHDLGIAGPQPIPMLFILMDSISLSVFNIYMKLLNEVTRTVWAVVDAHCTQLCLLFQSPDRREIVE